MHELAFIHQCWYFYLVFIDAVHNVENGKNREKSSPHTHTHTTHLSRIFDFFLVLCVFCIEEKILDAIGRLFFFTDLQR